MGCPVRPRLGHSGRMPVDAPFTFLQLHEIAEAEHRILDPFTDDQLMTLAAAAHVRSGTRILDLACGKGEMLCRWAQEFGTTGHGIDISATFLAAASRRAEDLHVADRVSFAHGDAAEHGAEPASFDVVSCLGATWIGGGVAGTLGLMAPAVRPDGLLLVGEPFWAQEPPVSAYESGGIGAEEFTTLAGTAARFAAAGMDLVEMVLADGASWDRYEARQWWSVTQWLQANPDEPRREQVCDFRDRSRASYLDYRRRCLGWGVFVLRPTG